MDQPPWRRLPNAVFTLISVPGEILFLSGGRPFKYSLDSCGCNEVILKSELIFIALLSSYSSVSSDRIVFVGRTFWTLHLVICCFQLWNFGPLHCSFNCPQNSCWWVVVDIWRISKPLNSSFWVNRSHVPHPRVIREQRENFHVIRQIFSRAFIVFLLGNFLSGLGHVTPHRALLGPEWMGRTSTPPYGTWKNRRMGTG